MEFNAAIISHSLVYSINYFADSYSNWLHLFIIFGSLLGVLLAGFILSHLEIYCKWNPHGKSTITIPVTAIRTFSIVSWSFVSLTGIDTMDQLLDNLFSARGYARERALSSIVGCFGASYCFQFAEENFAALLYGCLRSLKRGSSKEIILALRALGLLSITLGSGDKAGELYEELVPLIQEAMRSMIGPSLISVINCLAISSFVGANVFDKEAAMKMIWHVILSDPGEDVMSAAISAWSLLLTSVNVSLHRNYWKKMQMFYFLSLLDGDDQSVRAAAGDAIDLLLEMEYHEVVRIHETLVIGERRLELHSMSKLFQIEFMLDFLGPGFVSHMLENEFLHGVFNFTPEEQTLEEKDDKVYYCEREEAVVHVCMPMRVRGHVPTRLAIVNKGRTQLLKKQRMQKVLVGNCS